MNADQVRAYVNAKWPEAMQSPVAQAIAACTAPSADPIQYAEALAYARQCIDACEAAGIAFDGETLSHNIESNFPELEIHECDAIAAQAMEYAS